MTSSRPTNSRDTDVNASNGKVISKSGLNNHMIEFVRLNPVLYDCNDPNYSSHQIKNSVWSRFAEKYDMDIADVKSRWNILRTGFTTAKKRLQNGLIKNKKWEYLDKMMYLNDYLKPNDTIRITPKRFKDSNGNSHQQASENGIDEEDDLIEAEMEQELYEESISALSNTTNGQHEQSPQPRLNYLSNNNNTTNNSDFYSQLNAITNQFNHSDDLFKQYLQDLKNPTMMYLRSLLPTLTKYTDEQLNIVKYRIIGVLIEADKEFKQQKEQ